MASRSQPRDRHLSTQRTTYPMKTQSTAIQRTLPRPTETRPRWAAWNQGSWRTSDWPSVRSEVRRVIVHVVRTGREDRVHLLQDLLAKLDLAGCGGFLQLFLAPSSNNGRGDARL